MTEKKLTLWESQNSYCCFFIPLNEGTVRSVHRKSISKQQMMLMVKLSVSAKRLRLLSYDIKSHSHEYKRGTAEGKYFQNLVFTLLDYPKDGNAVQKSCRKWVLFTTVSCNLKESKSLFFGNNFCGSRITSGCDNIEIRKNKASEDKGLGRPPSSKGRTSQKTTRFFCAQKGLRSGSKKQWTTEERTSFNGYPLINADFPIESTWHVTLPLQVILALKQLPCRYASKPPNMYKQFHNMWVQPYFLDVNHKYELV